MMRHRSAFTLIELLVVISVIAVLMSILMPVLRKAREAGQRAVCLSNIKQLNVAWLMYAGDNDEMLVSSEAGFDEDVLRKINPQFIFVNYYDDTHQDHRYLAEATISATRYIKNVLFYEVPTTQNFSPNVFVDINDVLEKKISLLKAHESQVMKTNIEDLSIAEIAKSSANFRGIQGRVKYAEGFRSLRLFINM